MTFSDGRDQELEELLRSTLHGEAEAVSTNGDGLSRIQERIAVRRGRRAWLRPVAAVGAVAVVGGAGAVAYALSRPPSRSDSVLIQPPPTVSPSQTPSTTPATSTPPVDQAVFPPAGMFPYTSAVAARTGTVTWTTDPVQVALHFVSDFAGVAGVDQLVHKSVTSSTDAAVTLGRLASGRMVPVTTVQLARFDKSWIVVGADDARGLLKLTTPVQAVTTSSPVFVSGPDFGVDESVEVTVRSLHAPSPLATDHVSFGSDGKTWSSRLSFAAAPDAVGAVVAYEASMEDGGPARLTVRAIRFTSASVQTAAYPQFFYGVKNGQVTQFSSRTGDPIRYLTSQQPGGGATDPQVVGDHVYFIAGSGTCANSLMSVPVSGGSTANVTSPQAGYAITSYAVSADAQKVALFESACSADGSRPQGLLVSSVVGTTTTHTVEFRSFPPMIVGDPSWEPDGQHVDAVLRTGNLAGPVRWNAFSAPTGQEQGDPSGCTVAPNGLPSALQVDAGGSIWMAMETGSSMTVVRCSGGTQTTMFALPGNDTPSDLAVSGDGSAVLVTDGNGQVWRWTTGTTATKLTPRVPQLQVSW